MFQIEKITIVRGVNSMDSVHFKIKGPSPTPDLEPVTDHPPSFRIDVKPGYAEEWLKELGIKLEELEEREFELIDARRSRPKFGTGKIE